MSSKLQIASLIIGIGFFLFIFYIIKRRKLTPSDSILWLILALFLISIPVLENLYKWISVNIIGIAYTENLIYIILIGFLIIYVLFLASKIGRLNDQVKQLISYTAILEDKIKNKNK